MEKMSRRPFYPKHRHGAALTVPSSPAPPLGDLIETITKDSLSDQSPSGEPATISGVCPVASYNWVKGPHSKIIIPGKPPRWTPLTEARRLQEDRGTFYRDVNSASFPHHPLEPAVISIMQMCPKPIPVDVVACGSTLGNLLRFSRGVDQDRPFRMLVEVVGGTVHLIRRENSPGEVIPGVRGYGHTFPEAYTTWDADVKRSKSHQRVIAYEFGGLDLLVRFQGDGFIPDDNPNLAPASMKKASSDEDPAAQLSKLHFQEPTPSSSDSSKSKLQVAEGGSAIPQSTIFDLKTRSVLSKNKDILGEQLARLWVAQVEQFVLAFHTRGLFETIEVKNVRAELTEWEDLNQSSLQRLVALIRLIIDRALKTEDGRMEIVYSPDSSLELRKQCPGVRKAFSDPVQESWSAWLQGCLQSAEGSEAAEGEIVGKDSPRWLDIDAELDRFDDDSEPDYTACDAECGYCGKCDY